MSVITRIVHAQGNAFPEESNLRELFLCEAKEAQLGTLDEIYDPNDMTIFTFLEEIFDAEAERRKEDMKKYGGNTE